MACAVRILFRITFNTCVVISPNRKRAQLKLEFYRVSAVLWSTADNFDATSCRCAGLGVNYFSCTNPSPRQQQPQSALAGFWNFACEHGSSTPQPIPSCHRLRFSRLYDPVSPVFRVGPHDHHHTTCSFTVDYFNTSRSVTPPLPPRSSCLLELMPHQQGCNQQATSVTFLAFNFFERFFEFY